jgi:hypothetical protein
MRSPSAVGSTLIVTSLFVLAVPLISLVMHFADVHMPLIISIPSTSSISSTDAMVTFPRIVASGLVMYLAGCLNYVGRKSIEESG